MIMLIMLHFVLKRLLLIYWRVVSGKLTANVFRAVSSAGNCVQVIKFNNNIND